MNAQILLVDVLLALLDVDIDVVDRRAGAVKASVVVEDWLLLLSWSADCSSWATATASDSAVDAGAGRAQQAVLLDINIA